MNDNNGLYFIVGGIVVVVAIMAFIYFGNGPKAVMPDTGSPTIVNNTPAPDHDRVDLNVNVDKRDNTPARD